MMMASNIILRIPTRSPQKLSWSFAGHFFPCHNLSMDIFTQTSTRSTCKQFKSREQLTKSNNCRCRFLLLPSKLFCSREIMTCKVYHVNEKLNKSCQSYDEIIHVVIGLDLEFTNLQFSLRKYPAQVQRIGKAISQ